MGQMRMILHAVLAWAKFYLQKRQTTKQEGFFVAIFYIHFDEKRERKGMCPAVLVKRQSSFSMNNFGIKENLKELREIMREQEKAFLSFFFDKSRVVLCFD